MRHRRRAGPDRAAGRAMRASGASWTKGAIGVLVTVALASIAAASAAGGDARQAPGPLPPRVIQLSYSDVNDGTFPRYRLMAFSRRTDSVDFATRFGGKKASSGARLDKSITDTDIKGNAKHPFVIVRKQGGRRVLKLIRKSLDRRGEAKLRVRAKRDDRVDAIRLKIVLARCSQDPPLFPVDCEVNRSGKHV